MSPVSARELAGCEVLRGVRTPPRRRLLGLWGVQRPDTAKFCGECARRYVRAIRRVRFAPGVLHPEAPRREDPHLQERTGGRAQAGDRALRRPQGLDGAARRPRSRGGAQDPRPGARAHDGGRASLRGYGEPGDGRRDHGALRRAAGPRRSRSAGVLRSASDAGERKEVRGRGAALTCGRGQDPRRAELRRGRGARHRQRSPHGLHRRRADDPPGRADGAARRSGRDRDHARYAGAGRGLRRGEVAGARAGEGARRAGGSLRGDGGGSGADPAAGGRPARADALRRSRRRAGAAPPRPAARRRRSRPDGRNRRRGGRGQVTPRLRVHPLASPPGLAGPRERRRSLTARRRATCR